jgi:DNA repair protein RadC
MLAALSREPREQFRALFLDSKNRVLHEEILSIGTVNHVSVYPREVISYALSVHASAIVLVHNHPTGDPKPSEVDVALTLQLQEMCEDLNIKLHDHIIVGDGRVFSFLKHGGLTHNRDRNNRRAYLVANEHDPEPSATS